METEDETALTDFHLLVLAFFRRSGGAWPEQIATALGFDLADVTRLLRDLEAQGLIERAAGH